MTKPIKILGAVLAGQLALAALFHSLRGGMGAFEADAPLLGLSADDYDRVAITEPDRPSLTLALREGRWVLPDRWDFPVSTAKIAQTIDFLRDMKRSWPVGETASARKRFRVTEDGYERRVAFFKGDKEKAVLYIGTSPGYRKVHLRPADADDVFVGEFAVHELPTRAEDWEDKTFLHLDRNAIARVTTPAVTVERKEGEFRVSDLADGEETSAGAMDSFLSRFTGLAFAELLGPEVKPSYGLDKPMLTATVDMADGRTISYAFGKAKDGEDYYLKPSNADYVFRVGSYAVESIRDTARSALVRKKTQPPPPSS